MVTLERRSDSHAARGGGGISVLRDHPLDLAGVARLGERKHEEVRHCAASGVMPAALITVDQRFVSVTMSSRNAAGVPGIASTP